jgi:hypothetical protein
MNTRFGVLAYGPNPRLHVECHGAILTAMAFAPAGLEFVVLTDRPESYRWLSDSVTIEPLDTERLHRWRGPRQDRYRPKIEALRWLARDGGAHVVLADTDTLTRRPLDPLIECLDRGRFLLHRREYALAAPPRRGDRKLKSEILGRVWHGITPAATAAMWNGGIVGCAASNAVVLDEVAGVFDEMRPVSTHFAVEQLAYSVVFEARGRIEEAAPWIDHYWANRHYFGAAIERELAGALTNGLTARQAAARLRAAPIVGPLDARPGRWRRTVGRLARGLGLSDHDD